MGISQRNQLHKHNIPTNNGFLGTYNFFDKNIDYETIFSKCLKSVDNHAIIMCHPGYNDLELQKLDQVTSQREAELLFLKQFDIQSNINIKI